MKNVFKNEDAFYITQVNKIIKMLPDDTFEKIPNGIRNFFESNADTKLEQDMQMTPNMINQGLPENTLKYLKVVNYYINDRKL